MDDFTNTVNVIGEDALTDSIIDRTISKLFDNNICEVGFYTFYNCTNLTSVDLPVATSIRDSAFRSCKNLASLILGNTENVCSIKSNTLANTKIASGTGYIYVPAALIDSYKTASNWSTYANQFRALEDYTVDGTTTGELDSTKI